MNIPSTLQCWLLSVILVVIASQTTMFWYTYNSSHVNEKYNLALRSVEICERVNELQLHAVCDERMNWVKEAFWLEVLLESWNQQQELGNIVCITIATSSPLEWICGGVCKFQLQKMVDIALTWMSYLLPLLFVVLIVYIVKYTGRIWAWQQYHVKPNVYRPKIPLDSLMA